MSYQPETIIYELGENFYDEVQPAKFPKRIPRYLNHSYAENLGLDSLLKDDSDWIRHFCEFEPLPDNIKAPLALRYHGHQFQSYNPELGDGRGFLYAQLRDKNDRILDLGTKGSGQTPYSRFGDGRLTLKGAVRETIASEMLESLGVNTSKSFCFFETGEQLQRHDEPSPTRSAVLTRLSHGHIRIGTFERLAYYQDLDNIQRLLQYCMKHLLGEKENPNNSDTYLQFFDIVQKRCAQLSAQWMLAGFVHGVLNTDNINITGESFDYGPFRFLPIYDSHFVAAYFDHSGLYAYGRQPSAVHWNLAQLAGCLSLIGDQEKLIKSLEDYPNHFATNVHQQLLRRLGLKSKDQESDDILLSLCFSFLKKSQIPFECFFYDLFAQSNDEHLLSQDHPRAKYYSSTGFKNFLNHRQKYEIQEGLNQNHSQFQKDSPPDVRIDSIEAVWSSIEKEDNWTPYFTLISDIQSYGRALGFRTGNE